MRVMKNCADCLITMQSSAIPGYWIMNDLALLSVSEMVEADRLTVAGGIASLALMENAGRAVAHEARAMAQPGTRIQVLCGPGKNGGDGFVAARLLKRLGYEVQVTCLVEPDRLKGDSAEMARAWNREFAGGTNLDLSDADLIIDALFGSGLSRPLEGPAAEIVDRLRQFSNCKPILAIDVPSGIDADTGRAPAGRDGPLYHATRTVTFFRAKPAHLLLPGRGLCGALTIADIGIPSNVLDRIRPRTFRNDRLLWQPHRRPLGTSEHKYSRGHAVVVSGTATRTGAARLAARGALRIGAGLVTVASPQDASVVNAMHLTAIMVEPFNAPNGLSEILADERRNVVVVGPGCGVGETTQRMVEIVIAAGANAVLDADALTSFEGAPERLLTLTRAMPGIVLTPHDGEFKRLFPDATGSKIDRARYAASRCGATVILKGADTVIASSDGRAAINCNAPPTLATAGAGDVLAGFVAGLLAQGMPSWSAACAAVWLHGECANVFGPGLIAEDLPEQLPKVLARLSGQH